MLPMLAGSFFAIAVVAIVAGILELRTARRLLTAKTTPSPGGLLSLEAEVRATDGYLESPLLKHRCVMFSVSLFRRRLHENVGAGALFFNENRPFSLVGKDGSTMAIDPKKNPVFFLGLSSTEKPLPFLPQSIVGLLVQRFGHKGQVWAEEHVVRASETTLDDGASVFALVEDGVVKMLSTQPLTRLGRAALLRGSAATAVALTAFSIFWLLR